MKVPKYESRTIDQIKKHYEIEKNLANKLRSSTKDERGTLYTKLYDELFRLVPTHPLLTQKENYQNKASDKIAQINLLKRFLNHDKIFLEVGCGDCSLAFKIANYVKKIYAIDVSYEITANNLQPDNFQLIISDGCNIPVESSSIDVAYSNDLMEHLHPEDALEQLRNIYNILRIGGVYLCHTPNRLSGPHDVSKYFDRVATGFHLKEYTVEELVDICKTVGFSKVQLIVNAKKFVLPVLLPVFPFIVLEKLLCLLPNFVNKKVSRWFPVRVLLGINIVATK